MKKSPLFALGFTMVFCLSQLTCRAWDYEGHRFVNQLALSSLPPNFPVFAVTAEAKARVAYLAGEPDRWRNMPDLNQDNTPDHYLDMDALEDYGIDYHKLTHYRYDFAAQLTVGRATHPDKFKPIDPAQNRDHTRQLEGFLPYAIMDNYDKLKSAFSYLKAFQSTGGTEAEITNAQEDVIYAMGVLGHYVGDAAQPLHTTKHFNGWVGENPHNYTREKIHARVDSYFLNLTPAGFHLLEGRIHPARLPSDEPGLKVGDTFSEVMQYIMAQHDKVEPLYKLEKEGKLFGEGDAGTEGKAFLEKQLVAGGQMLGDLWYAAWQSAPEDTYLVGQLNRRKLAQHDTPAKK